MIITNLDTLPGFRIDTHYGLVVGSIVETRHLVSHLQALWHKIWGGEVHGYSKLLEDVHTEALQRLKEKAHYAGANAVLNIRFATSEIGDGAAELIAYGTAVRVIADA
ncbi:MAG: YbjQ family protein [Alphaproteobacteria bacterium]|nr:MAG: YbjQ family protein [Alphaproteobacteria bacterium]